ncbi:hypothetical protein PDESU_00422 [Pontiella desulfatans]|uniref:Uncharacterized protein n=1 Tax=Pontiella desulfatans TaxID=2750659 RepID=A0A6C2TW24_PONDE|nr:hypothetical protein [Pontiella desulfatans]VGO11875.1 hypothetical protein PDESU_00422 [Pontiella desulfatans]
METQRRQHAEVTVSIRGSYPAVQKTLKELANRGLPDLPLPTEQSSTIELASQQDCASTESNPPMPDLADFVDVESLVGTTLEKQRELKKFLLEYDFLVTHRSDLKSQLQRFSEMHPQKNGVQLRDISVYYKYLKERNEWKKFYARYDMLQKEHSRWPTGKLLDSIAAEFGKYFPHTIKYHEVLLLARPYFQALIDSGS